MKENEINYSGMDKASFLVWVPTKPSASLLHKSSQSSTVSSRLRPAFPRCSQRTPPEQPTNDAHSQNDDSSEKPSKPSLNWREFRAALVAGSVARHQEAKRTAYRTDHWAHPVSIGLS